MTAPVLRVQGRGELSAAPDLVVLSFAVSALEKEFDDAVRMAAERVEALRGVLEAEGIERAALKTESFAVRAEYEWDRDRTVQQFMGYAAVHQLRLEQDRTDRAGPVLDAAAASAADAEVQVSFELRDRDGFRQRLLAAAVGAAHRNAETIAAAAGLRLGRIARIEYGWSELRVSSPTAYASVNGLYARASPTSFEPLEVEGSESVTVEWELRPPGSP